MALKATYGLPLEREEELAAWSMFHLGADHDDLGYVTEIRRWVPYTPREYDIVVCIWGRRSGKTSAYSAFIIAYEATLGGHEDYVTAGQPFQIIWTAHRLELAVENLSFVTQILESSIYLAQELDTSNRSELVISNGLRIVPSPPTLKGARGFAIPVAFMDEAGFYYQKPDAANPDVEIERAISPAQAQFPHYKRGITSTPWGKQGLLYKYHQAGTCGWKLPADERESYDNVLVLEGQTAAVENPALEKPGIARKFLTKERARDLGNFEREYLIQFSDTASSFLQSERVRAAVDKGVRERAPKAHNYYIGALDPAFRGDNFAFTVVHVDPTRGVVQDYAHVWRPVTGQPLNPTQVLAEIAPLARSYGITTLFSDQYQFEALRDLAQSEFQLSIQNVDFTGKSKATIFGSLQSLVNQGRIRLLDDPGQVAELTSLVKTLSGVGHVRISAPSGMTDDQACVLAIAARQAIMSAPGRIRAEEKPHVPTVEELSWQQVQRQGREAPTTDWYYG